MDINEPCWHVNIKEEMDDVGNYISEGGGTDILSVSKDVIKVEENFVMDGIDIPTSTIPLQYDTTAKRTVSDRKRLTFREKLRMLERSVPISNWVNGDPSSLDRRKDEFVETDDIIQNKSAADDFEPLMKWCPVQDNAVENDRFIEASPEVVDKPIKSNLKTLSDGQCSSTEINLSDNLYKDILIHNSQPPFDCSECCKSFAQKCLLKRHLLVHSDLKPHECKVCGKQFRQKSQLNAHLLIHSGEKAHECAVCGRKFTLKSDLNKHRLIHTGEKPFECEMCGQKFLRKSFLTYHIRINCNDKPHECGECGRKFTQKGDLNKHAFTHASEKPFECGVCGGKYSRRAYLNKHLKIHFNL